MKPILQAVLMLGLIMPAFSGAPKIDFDGANNKHESVGTYVNEALQNGSAELSDLEIKRPTTPSKNETDGIPSGRLFEI